MLENRVPEIQLPCVSIPQNWDVEAQITQMSVDCLIFLSHGFNSTCCEWGDQLIRLSCLSLKIGSPKQDVSLCEKYPAGTWSKGCIKCSDSLTCDDWSHHNSFSLLRPFNHHLGGGVVLERRSQWRCLTRRLHKSQACMSWLWSSTSATISRPRTIKITWHSIWTPMRPLDCVQRIQDFWKND